MFPPDFLSNPPLDFPPDSFKNIKIVFRLFGTISLTSGFCGNYILGSRYCQFQIRGRCHYAQISGLSIQTLWFLSPFWLLYYFSFSIFPPILQLRFYCLFILRFYMHWHMSMFNWDWKLILRRALCILKTIK